MRQKRASQYKEAKTLFLFVLFENIGELANEASARESAGDSAGGQ